MGQLLLPILAVVAGFAITLQAQFMGLMDKALGTKESVFITYVSGGVIVALIALATGGLNLKGRGELPWYAFTSGVLGLVIVGLIGYVIPRWGPTRALTLVIAAQFILAVLVDHFGLFAALQRPLDFQKIIGLVIMLGGVWLVMR